MVEVWIQIQVSQDPSWKLSIYHAGFWGRNCVNLIFSQRLVYPLLDDIQLPALYSKHEGKDESHFAVGICQK